MWIETIVMPREEPAAHYRAAPQRDRSVAYAAACAEGEHFHDTVLSYLRSHQLMEAVRWVSAPGSIPMVTLHCTFGVLEQLQKEPRFEAGRSLTLTGF
ncbi:hypothetical protein [Vitiosangium sp. GDMCC 1.1324]|uniref:hypothetical protein n=1 Tax=Vitiosangium sp. (strain GDMCC 1.1324) TaxID=2138576 RepID=UPI000D34C0B8|nr:hypothetical protein [Vitiosangium sp. GDMCC 1.1324]PTL78137.1 hypothetical protein DAT35_41740 [Vitiosangium sp. GDMCC 1.1324]